MLVAFLSDKGAANQILLPVLKNAFPQLVGEDEKFYLDDKVLRHGLNELSGLSFQSASAHVMGEAFQALMGPRLRGDKGQFFTPKSLVRAMIAVLRPDLEAKIVDPACGTGGFLVETFSFLENATFSGQLVGMDKDRDLCRLAEAALEIVAPGSGLVLNLNSLDMIALRALPEGQSPFGADFVLTNPPFGAKIKITERDILNQYRLGHAWVGTKSGWLQENQLAVYGMC